MRYTVIQNRLLIYFTIVNFQIVSSGLAIVFVPQALLCGSWLRHSWSSPFLEPTALSALQLATPWWPEVTKGSNGWSCCASVRTLCCCCFSHVWKQISVQSESWSVSFAIRSGVLVPVSCAVWHHVGHSLLLCSQIHSEQGKVFPSVHMVKKYSLIIHVKQLITK